MRLVAMKNESLSALTSSKLWQEEYSSVEGKKDFFFLGKE